MSSRKVYLKTSYVNWNRGPGEEGMHVVLKEQSQALNLWVIMWNYKPRISWNGKGWAEYVHAFRAEQQAKHMTLKAARELCEKRGWVIAKEITLPPVTLIQVSPTRWVIRKVAHGKIYFARQSKSHRWTQSLSRADRVSLAAAREFCRMREYHIDREIRIKRKKK